MLFNFLSGGGEMGALMRVHDWSASPLGLPDTWPATLKTSIRLLLTSNHPMLIWWGHDLLQFYNDAYRQTMGPERHPGSLGKGGKQCWAEIWHLIGSEVDLVMSGKGATWHEDTLVPVTRHGKRENVWWTYGLSPIEDESGVQGVLVICNDVTKEHVLKENIKQSYHTLIEVMDQGFCVIESLFDASGRPIDYRFIETNPAFEAQTGLHNPLGKTALELVPDLEGHWIETYGRVALTGQSIRFIEESVPMGRWFDVYAGRIGNPENRQVALLFRDITEQKRLERELQKSTERQTFLLELADSLRKVESPENMITTACAMLGRKLAVSRVVYGEVIEAGNAVFIRGDWTASGVPGLAGTTKAMSNFGPDTIASLSAGQVAVYDNVPLNDRAANYADAPGEINDRVALLVPLVKSGKLSLVFALHQTEPYHWKDEEIEFCQEVAERTWSAVEAARAQAELRFERDQSKHIFNSMAEGFLLLDPELTVLQANAEALRITERTALEVIGRKHWDVWPDFKGGALDKLYCRVMEARAAGTDEIFVDMPGGSQFWLELRAYPSLRGGLAVFFRDITERKQAQQLLQDANRRKDEFLAMLAHELRNPLAPVSAAADLLALGRLDGERIKQTSAVIARQVRHMTGLVDDLLDVSRVTRGLVSLEKARLDAKRILYDAVEQVRPLIEARRHRLALQMPPQPADVFGDHKRLVQIVTNLLSNAAKYTPEGGDIALGMAVDVDDVVVSVTDNGIGMAAPLVTQSFELFAQAERSSDRSQGGLGLGLALVRSLVELHGGSVIAYSEGVGKGSGFTVRLPRLKQPADVHDPGQNDSGIAISTAALKIMIVDDNTDAAQMLAMLVETLGYQVVVEHSSTKALVRAQAEAPDACLLDIGMPDMDGYELARRLRAKPNTAKTKLIAITGYGQEQDRESALHAGFDAHFVKPVDTAKLAALLNKVSKA